MNGTGCQIGFEGCNASVGLSAVGQDVIGGDHRTIGIDGSVDRDSHCLSTWRQMTASHQDGGTCILCEVTGGVGSGSARGITGLRGNIGTNGRSTSNGLFDHCQIGLHLRWMQTHALIRVGTSQGILGFSHDQLRHPLRRLRRATHLGKTRRMVGCQGIGAKWVGVDTHNGCCFGQVWNQLCIDPEDGLVGHRYVRR